MKKILMLSAAALALAVAPASANTTSLHGPAGPGPGATSAIASWQINGTAASYCTLGTGPSPSGSNVSITDTSGHDDADGIVNITQFQGPGDHANAWSASIGFPYAVCNTNFKVTALTTNGGLTFTGTPSTNPSFANTELYQIGVNFDGLGWSGSSQDVTVSHAGNGGYGLASGGPTAGTFKLSFYGNADSTKYLLAGTYTDSVTVTMAPNP